MNDDNDKQVRQFKEMVRARSLIQSELIELLEFQRRYQKDLQASLYLRVSGNLASAGFALWRSAFLFTHEEGGPQAYLENVEAFLSKIISDNTIAFNDEKKTWSLWHYVGVARSSLLEALTLLRRPVEDHRLEIMRRRFGDPPLLSATAAEQWNELFEAMQTVRKSLTARFDLQRTMPKLSDTGGTDR